MVDEFLRALAIANDLLRQIAADGVDRGGERIGTGIIHTGEAAGCPAAPVAKTSNVSLVEVSPSTVMLLNVMSPPTASVIACNSAGSTAASVKT